MVRLSKAARRAQLLAVAHEILARDGSDVLTLAHLAEQAGVSKPIAYDHFGTRARLLAAMFVAIDAQQIERMRTAMAVGGTSLRAATEIAAAGYLDCLVGPEYEVLCAALLAHEEWKDVLRDSRESFADAYRDVLAPFVTLDGTGGRALLTGLVGAAEALARDVHDEELSSRVAIDALAALMFATLEPLAIAEGREPSSQTPTSSPPATQRTPS